MRIRCATAENFYVVDIDTKSDSDIETLSCNSSSIEVLGTNGGDSGSNSDIVE